ncbi:uncharacterized protein HRG_09920 [Hirsutella rhossiliensis]|uniref:N-acetyltransferase domain-containing protein n=1 Tax=Hirsutella rhossiliensis TaxID=111463 RepID=A0A9P8MPJ9_9HYPO|nr:uncharacterized protein HRG_09920 [Hirsutella rhossiliensis]KAH0958875.1 hypothetical protein HRG_09920 [Hirsutella rhossiliensis]
MLRSYLASDRHRILVLEISASESGMRSGPLIVSAAEWDAPAADATKQDGPADGLHESADGKGPDSQVAAFAKIPDKLAALARASFVGKQKCFAGRGPFLHLDILATAPEYQGRGYAKVLTLWGKDLARKTHRPLFVQAASRAYILFSGLGFVDIGPVSLPANQADEETAFLKALIFDPGNTRLRDSMLSAISRFLSRFTSDVIFPSRASRGLRPRSNDERRFLPRFI